MLVCLNKLKCKSCELELFIFGAYGFHFWERSYLNATSSLLKLIYIFVRAHCYGCCRLAGCSA